MACSENIRRISAYHDGELPPAEAASLHRHMEQCPVCRQELERLRALSRWLSAASAPKVPAEVLERLHHSVRPSRDRTVLRLAETLTAVAAAVLVVCSVLLWRQREAAGAGQSPPAAWEKAAVMPPTSQPVLAGGVETEDGADVDLQIAKSILGGGDALDEGGYEHE